MYPEHRYTVNALSLNRLDCLPLISLHLGEFNSHVLSLSATNPRNVFKSFALVIRGKDNNGWKLSYRTCWASIYNTDDAYIIDITSTRIVQVP